MPCLCHFKTMRKASHGRRDQSAIDSPALTTGRLNRYVARAGICSRRKADDLIDQGKVKVNGRVVSEYWHVVAAGDTVEVNGKTISPSPFQYILLNKPAGVITSVKDDRGRQTVLDLVADKVRPGMFPVGRLDRNTTGALVLTTDGDLAHRLMHPRFAVAKRYVAQLQREVSQRDLACLRDGVALEDGPAAADMAVFVGEHAPRCVALEIHTGRNRQVRRMFEALGHAVVSLERVAYAGLTTKGLQRGRWRILQTAEIRRMRRLVHLR